MLSTLVSFLGIYLSVLIVRDWNIHTFFKSLIAIPTSLILNLFLLMLYQELLLKNLFPSAYSGSFFFTALVWAMVLACFFCPILLVWSKNGEKEYDSE
tara:strand:- start:1228 stop:1521 length:294 start_codon:yes stop_codon:yes gene_type:complete